MTDKQRNDLKARLDEIQRAYQDTCQDHKAKLRKLGDEAFQLRQDLGIDEVKMANLMAWPYAPVGAYPMPLIISNWETWRGWNEQNLSYYLLGLWKHFKQKEQPPNPPVSKDVAVWPCVWPRL